MDWRQGRVNENAPASRALMEDILLLTLCNVDAGSAHDSVTICTGLFPLFPLPDYSPTPPHTSKTSKRKGARTEWMGSQRSDAFS